jgi:hypothetical protein
MSSSLLEALGPLLEGGTTRQVSRQLGIDEAQAGTAIQAAVPLILGALQRQTSNPGGLDSLAGALDRDHDGSVLDDAGSFLGRGAAVAAGTKILGHVLGGRKERAAVSLGKSTGLDAAKAMQLLAMLAPLVMGALGRAKRQGPAGGGGLADILGGATRQMDQRSPGLGGALGRILDADGDGSPVDDLARMAGNLGTLFGKG